MGKSFLVFVIKKNHKRIKKEILFKFWKKKLLIF